MTRGFMDGLKELGDEIEEGILGTQNEFRDSLIENQQNQEDVQKMFNTDQLHPELPKPEGSGMTTQSCQVMAMPSNRLNHPYISSPTRNFRKDIELTESEFSNQKSSQIIDTQRNLISQNGEQDNELGKQNGKNQQ